MASTLTRQADSPGGGARGDVNALGARTVSLGVYKLAMGNPYVVGGENIAAIWEDFKEVLAIVVQQVDVTAADRREFLVDLTNKKLLQYDAFNTEETATDQSAVADIRLLVFGYR
jgi:hypothetical protein